MAFDWFKGLGQPQTKGSTKLESKDEAEFQRWYGQMAKAFTLDENPDDPFYDYRGYFQGLKNGKSKMGFDRASGEFNFPSDFKLPGGSA